MATHRAKPLAGGIDLNYEVVGGTTAPTNPKENTIWINTNVDIGEHMFSYEWLDTTETIESCVIGEASRKMNSAGTLAGDAAWSMTKYYHVTSNSQYYLTFSETGACSAYYDENYNFISSFNVSKNAWTTLPNVPSHAVYVRFCIRTHTDTNDTNNFKYKYVVPDANNGDIWLQTAETTKYNFNALKKNELFLHVKNIYQLINGGWQEATASIYQNGEWIKFFYDTVVIDTSANAPVNIWNFSHTNAGTGGASATNGLTIRVDNNHGVLIEQVQRDFSGYSKIEIYVNQKYAVNSRDGELYFGIIETPTMPSLWNDSSIVVKYNATYTGTHTIDISGYNGTGYLIMKRNTGGYGQITKVKLYV